MARRQQRQYKRVRVDAVEAKPGGGVVGYLATVVILPVFILGLLYVKLNSDEVKLKRRLTQVRREYGLRSKELANLRLEAEMYRDGNHVRRQVDHMGLALGEPDHGQVIRMPAGIPVRSGTVRPDAVVAGR
jgi:hypothetical protein